MATQTKILATFTDPSDASQCRFEYDYDDGTLRMLVFRCINDTNQSARGWVARAENWNVNYQTTFLPNRTTEFNVGQGAQNRLQLTIAPNGKLDGVEYRLEWPA